jgi:hypothetical protein
MKRKIKKKRIIKEKRNKQKGEKSGKGSFYTDQIITYLFMLCPGSSPSSTIASFSAS